MCLCSPIAVGEIAKEAGQSNFAFCCLNCCLGPRNDCVYAIIHSCSTLTKLREKYHMPQAKLRDCCLHTWCGGCALAQELRFIQRANELQFAAALAGQSAVHVGPVRQTMP